MHDTVGRRIARLRKTKNLTQTDLARILGISKSTLGMYEIGQREPDVDMFIKIAEFFDVTMDYLIVGK